ncbi:MAG: redoxin family protein [Gammaproteobacteria bacterium]
MQDLKDKVVLIDFWTYSCINCMRTIPYLNDWYQKYHEKGLVVIGVHSPEFEFEKNLSNVKNAVIKDGIQYPVALDNQFVTWRNYSNQYWPAHFLIDKNGNVVYAHFGEGDYDIAESNIRYLLGLAHIDTKVATSDTQSSQLQSPETYLGYARAEHFSSPEILMKDVQSYYSTLKNLPINDWALQGRWAIMPDKIVSGQENASIEMHFYARKVFIVMGNTTNAAINVHLLLNGEKVVSQKGKDVINSSIKVDAHSIYSAIELNEAGSNTLKIISTAPGLEVYTLTFGD